MMYAYELARDYGYFLALFLLMAVGYFWGTARARSVVGGRLSELHSLPSYHGMLIAASIMLFMVAVFCIGEPTVQWLAKSRALAALPAEVAADTLKQSTAFREIGNLIAGQYSGTPSPELKAAAEALVSYRQIGSLAIFGIGVLGALLTLALISGRIRPAFRARNAFERIVKGILIACAVIAILTTIGIVLSVLTETLRFFFDPTIVGRPTVSQFLFGLEWNPQQALRADQGNIEGSYGFVPLLVGTLLITLIAIAVAGPIGLMSAIYLSEYASARFRAIAKPILEILAGIPTVVLGFFAALTVAPLIRGSGEYFGLNVASESALAAGLVMGMMIIPFISSLSDDVINAVPQSLRDGSYGMGATKSETIRKVVLPAAFAGIVSAFMLAISRAIGETMIVVMAAGLAANLTFNPLEAVTTITVQIKTILVGDQEFNTAKTLAAFALGLVLFLITLSLNFVAHRVVQRYREQYD
jgi:phosphate transport system permease protein